MDPLPFAAERFPYTPLKVPYTGYSGPDNPYSVTRHLCSINSPYMEYIYTSPRVIEQDLYCVLDGRLSS